jgi:long-chain fatty acid transport protein
MPARAPAVHLSIMKGIHMTLARLFCVFATVATLTADHAFASGFQLNEHGARAMAQGGAFAARANDLSAMYFNAAGLAYQNGLGAYVGGTMILPRTSFTSPGGKSTDMVNQTFVIPGIYVGYGMDNGLAFGVGFNAPFGLGTEWPEGWDGRRTSLKTDLQNFAINPTIAYKVSDELLVGVGVSYVFSSVKLSYNFGTYSSLAPPTPATTDAKVALDATGNAMSFNAGVIYKPMPAMSVGASYRHSTKIDYEGNAVFSNTQALANFFPGGTGKSTIKTPNQFFVGVSYDVAKSLTLEADYQWIGWSTYDSLGVILPDGPTFPLTGKPLQTSSKNGKDWADTYMIRVGGEYRCNELSLRLGFIYDASGQPNRTVEPILPDANRVEGTIGIGYALTEKLSIDVAYQIILFSDRTVTGPAPTGDLNAFPGTYKSSANLFGLSFGYQF